MQSNQLNRVLRLVRQTGDPVVVLDPETDRVVVMMDLDEYEQNFIAPAQGGEFDGGESAEAEDFFLPPDEFEPRPPRAAAAPRRTQGDSAAPVLDFGEDWARRPHSPILSEESLEDVPHSEEPFTEPPADQRQAKRDPAEAEEPVFHLEPVE